LEWIKTDRSEFPPILLGTSPFYGFDQFGKKKKANYGKRFGNVDQLADIIKEAITAGVDGVHVVPQSIRTMDFWDGSVVPPLYEAFELAEKETNTKLVHLPSILNPDVDIEATKGFDVRAFLADGNETDNYMVSGPGETGKEELNIDLLVSRKNRVQETGKEFGIATHCPATTLPRLMPHKELWDAIKIIMVPVNKTGYRIRPRWNNECEEAIKTARNSGKAIIAMKVMASGRIPPREGIEYVSKKEYVDAIVLGVGSPQEAKETFQIAHEIWKKR
jgi:hypothetical protein